LIKKRIDESINTIKTKIAPLKICEALSFKSRVIAKEKNVLFIDKLFILYRFKLARNRNIF
jgi:hypothetical protein